MTGLEKSGFEAIPEDPQRPLAAPRRGISTPLAALLMGILRPSLFAAAGLVWDRVEAVLGDRSTGLLLLPGLTASILAIVFGRIGKRRSTGLGGRAMSAAGRWLGILTLVAIPVESLIEDWREFVRVLLSGVGGIGLTIMILVWGRFSGWWPEYLGRGRQDLWTTARNIGLTGLFVVMMIMGVRLAAP